ncbi:hypothetical protein pb186bvf_013382 [Paramecium bursaria]
MNKIDLQQVKEYYQLKQQCRQIMILNNLVDIIRRKQIGLQSLVINELQIIWIKNKQLVKNFQTNSSKRIITQCFHKLKQTKYNFKRPSNNQDNRKSFKLQYTPIIFSDGDQDMISEFIQRRNHIQLRKQFYYFYHISRPKNKENHNKLVELFRILSKVIYKKCFDKLQNHHFDKMLRIKNWLKN